MGQVFSPRARLLMCSTLFLCACFLSLLPGVLRTETNSIFDTGAQCTTFFGPDAAHGTFTNLTSPDGIPPRPDPFDRVISGSYIALCFIHTTIVFGVFVRLWVQYAETAHRVEKFTVRARCPTCCSTLQN